MPCVFFTAGLLRAKRTKTDRAQDHLSDNQVLVRKSDERMNNLAQEKPIANGHEWRSSHTPGSKHMWLVAVPMPHKIQARMRGDIGHSHVQPSEVT